MEKLYERLVTFLLFFGATFYLTLFKLDWHVIVSLWLAISAGSAALVLEGYAQEMAIERRKRMDAREAS